MRRCVCCLLLLLGLVSPTALALDEETAAQVVKPKGFALRLGGLGSPDAERSLWV